MSESLLFRLLADVILILHVAVVLFVVGGLVLVLVGNWRKWHWVNALWFRIVHLATIAFVAAEAWFDIVCPLTTLEMWLRSKAKVATYEGSFIEHWLHSHFYFGKHRHGSLLPPIASSPW